MADMIASAKEEAARKRKEKILQLRKKTEDVIKVLSISYYSVCSDLRFLVLQNSKSN